jgi:UDP-N-acetylmuramoyl-tripeptide--D-alanyl-D-alanine ligase
MKRWDPQQLAHAADAQLLHAPPQAISGPDWVTIDSRDAGPGTLFIGLPGEHVHGGEFARAALEAGAWGVLTSHEHAAAAAAGYTPESNPPTPGVILSASDPLVALQSLATAWRRELGAQVIGVTGSTGKTSTKELLLALLSPHRLTVASKANFNTEIGMPLQILAAAAGTEVLVLEMAMRGSGQIAELARIAEPDVGVIVNIGPVHLESLGSIEAIAAAKAELIAALPVGGTVVVPAGEALLQPHMRADLRTLRFGDGGEVRVLQEDESRVEIYLKDRVVLFEVDFTAPHLRTDLLAAAAAAYAVGVTPGGTLEFSIGAGHGGHQQLAGGITLIDGAYNANPMSMRATLDELVATAASVQATRRVAVLGDMLELGPDGLAYHEQVGLIADDCADVLITVGPLAATMASVFHGEHHHAADAQAAAALVPSILRPGDVVLVKGSLGVGLKVVCEALTAGAPA